MAVDCCMRPPSTLVDTATIMNICWTALAAVAAAAAAVLLRSTPETERIAATGTAEKYTTTSVVDIEAEIKALLVVAATADCCRKDRPAGADAVVVATGREIVVVVACPVVINKAAKGTTIHISCKHQQRTEATAAAATAAVTAFGTTCEKISE